MGIVDYWDRSANQSSVEGLAREAIDEMQQRNFDISRGATQWQKFVLAFGHDGYHQFKRTQREVKLLRKYLRSEKIRELAFVTSKNDGRSWLMLLNNFQECDELSVDDLSEAVWLCHWLAGISSDDELANLKGFDPCVVERVLEAVW